MELLLIIFLAVLLTVGVFLLSDRRPRRRIERVVVDERPRVDLRERVAEDEVVETRRTTRR